MVSLAIDLDRRLVDVPPGANRQSDQRWSDRMPVMRAFPRLAVEVADGPVVDARWDEEPERWDGMA